MKLLENKMRESDLSLNAPPSGHKDRFAKRLDEHFGKTRSIKWQIPAYAASIVFLVSTIAILLFNNKTVVEKLLR